ncbi:interferon-inducible GTPase 5-like [Emys orbicularis]|uniref:interferon-inducible GTPase 5-like n=1 Tax=Emys orbicularis TaxID=82168 RepID=UPI0031FC25E8
MAGRLSRTEIEELQAIVERGNLMAAAAKLQEKLKSLENTPLDIAITGPSGSGKSSFVNAILGLHDDDEGAAETGVTQKTMKPNAYPHPKLSSVTIWDLPGIGTPNFQPDKYLKQVNFNNYDFFIIMASERFTSHHTNLAQKIQKMGKRFYYVRSKVDADLNAERRKRHFSKEKTLHKIREDCIENLRAVGEASPQVFLLCNWDLADYDFQLLQETLENELDAQKRHVFILAMPNISAKILEKKKAELQEHIWEAAIVSCVIGAVPVPGLSLICDVALLVSHMILYSVAFGLDDESLTRLAEQVDKPVAELKSAIIKSPLASEITHNFALTLLSRSACGALMVAEFLLKFIPALGSLAGGGISLVTTRYMLKNFLDEAAEDAQKVLAKALEPKAKEFK